LTVLRLLWGLILLAFVVSPPAALVMTVIVAKIHRRGTYGHPSVTLKGEVVRSEAEKIIADYFTRSGIRYVYEQPAMGRWGSGGLAGRTSTSRTMESTSSTGAGLTAGRSRQIEL
jgi:hypothetical protein